MGIKEQEGFTVKIGPGAPVTFLLDKVDAERLKARAKRDGLSPCEFICRSIKKALQNPSTFYGIDDNLDKRKRNDDQRPW